VDELLRWAGEFLAVVIILGLAIAVIVTDARGWLEQLDGIEFDDEE
jgi:hypothetical protein